MDYQTAIASKLLCNQGIPTKAPTVQKEARLPLLWIQSFSLCFLLPVKRSVSRENI